MRVHFRGLTAFLLAGTLAACVGDAASPERSETAAPAEHGTPAISASEPFDDVVGLDWRGPDGEREALWAWVADTPEKRALGLMHRTELPEQAGMIFVFPADNSGGFWMKNTLIPLSVAYLAADGSVLAILDMEPCAADPCPSYDPGMPYRYAVEANTGWFAARGIGPAWRLSSGLPEVSA